jgi:hypothetical protein
MTLLIFSLSDVKKIHYKIFIMTTLPGFFKVEKIVGKRYVEGKPQYKVKWLGWPPSTNTYEPIENLQQALEVVA